jgi:AraC-like DNA-binding protein
MGHSWGRAPAGLVPCVVSASYCERPARAPTRRIVHSLWVLDYARSDCGLARVGSPRSRWWPRTPGMAHLYPPGTPYWEHPPTGRDSICEAWVVFDGGDQAGLRTLLDPHRRFARMADPNRRLDGPLRDIALAGSRLGDAGFWQAQSILALLCGLLQEAVRQPDGTLLLPAVPAASSPRRDLVDAAREYFRAHLGEKITLASVARHLAMSPSSFSHRFTRQAGRSPMAALTAMRIEFAKGLLLRGLKMEAIAFQTGFFDAFHFSKTFRKLCGMSPSQFRRDYREVQRPESA